MILRVLEARDRSQKKKTLLRSMQCILSWKKANMDAVQGLLKKHDAFETDISVHGDRCTDICEAGQQLIDDRNHHADSIAQRCEQLRNKVK